MPSPVGWWTHRKEPISEATSYPQLPATPLPVVTEVELAPAPVPYTSWWSVGRDVIHAGTRRQIPPQNLAVSDWLSVSQWPFVPGMKANPTSLITPYQPTGFFNPQVTRANIDSPKQTSLGMLTAVNAPVLGNVDYMKLV